MTTMKAQLEISADASGVEAGVSKAKRSLADLGASAAQSGKAAADGINRIGETLGQVGNGGDASAKKVDVATKSMIQSIQRTTAVMEAGSKSNSKYYETLAAQRGVDVSALKPYLDNLDAVAAKQKLVEQSTRAIDPAFKQMGVSAAQTANAMRMVPAQMTDIVTSLQGGQSAMTVFIQQGGQLKDMFGGIGPAARALGSYVAGLVNPFTLAAGAAGILAVAYHEGSKEAQAYNRALLLTGNAAGTTANQLADMAARISKFGATQGSAAAALAELAGTGKIAAANLEQFSRVAIQMEKTVGQSVAETAKDLAELGKSPVEASEKLSEKYRYLTSTIYEQIKALQDQGRSSEAAALAQKAYADAFDTTSKNLEQNLGIVEKGWRGITSVAKGAWDAMLGVGRKRTLSEQLADVAAEIAKGEKPFDPSFGGNAEARSKLGINKELQASLQELIRLEQRQGTVVAANNEQNAARIAWLKEGDKYLSKSAEREREIAKARAEGAAAGATQTEIEKRIADIREKYKEKSAAAANTEVANLKARIQGERDYLEQLKLHGSAAEKLNQGEKDALKYSEQLKGTLDAKTRARTEELLVQAKISAGILKETDALKEMVKAMDDAATSRVKFNLSLVDGLKKIEDDVKAQEIRNARIGLSKEAIAELDAAELEHQATILEGRAIKEADKNLDFERYDLYKAQANALRDLASAKRIGGAREAAKELSDQWKKDFDRIEDWIGDAIARGVTKGKDIWKSLIDGLKASFARLVLSPIISPIAAFGASMLNPGAAQAQGTAGSAFGTASSIYSTGKTLWEGFSTGFNSFGDTIATSVQRGMNFFNPSGAEAAMQYGPVQNSALASNVGTVAGYAGNAVAGYGIQKAISNGFEIGNGKVVDALTLIASAYFGPIAGVVAGLVNRAFGSKVVGSGVMGSVTGDDFSGSSYQFKKGGWFKSDKTVTSALDKETDTAFQDAIKGMYSNFSDLGKTIGVGGDLLKDFSYEFRLALADFDDAGKQKEIQRALSSMSDSMATEFVDSFRTSIDTAKQAANRYFTNTIDGQKDFGPGEVVSKAAISSPLDPYIKDMVRIFDKFKEGVAGVEGSEGQLSTFTTSLFSLGKAFSESQGYLKLFGESLDFTTLEGAGKTGETVVDTFARLNTVFSATSTVAAILGQDAKTAFGAVGLASTDARNRLISLAGGLDTLASQASFFAQNFLTEAEQLKPASDQVAEVFGKFGIAGDITKDQFAGIVKSIDLSTEAGQKMYASLIGIAPAFLQVANYAEATAAQVIESAKATAQAQEDAAQTAARAAQDAAQAAKDAAQAISDAAMSAVDAAFSGVQRAIEAERKTVTQAYQTTIGSLTTQIDGVTGSIGKLASLSSTLKSTVNSMRLDSQLQTDRASASAQIQAALAIAKAGGVFPDADQLQNALSTVAQPNEQLYSSFVEFQRNYLKDKNTIAELADLTDNQLSIEEKTLDALKAQKDAAEKAYQAELTRLDGILDSAQAQIDALNGIDTSVKAVTVAIATLQGAIAGAMAVRPATSTPTSGGSTGTSSIVSDLYATYAGKAGSQIDAEGAAYWAARVASGESAASIAQSFQDSVKAVRGYATGGDRFGGYRIVGENGPELEATGPSRIFNASQTAQILRGDAPNEALINEIKALREEVVQLRQANSTENRAIAHHTRSTAEVLDQVTQGGGAMLVENY